MLTQGTTVLFDQPLASVADLTIDGTADNETITLDFRLATLQDSPLNLAVDGGTGVDLCLVYCPSWQQQADLSPGQAHIAGAPLDVQLTNMPTIQVVATAGQGSVANLVGSTSADTFTANVDADSTLTGPGGYQLTVTGFDKVSADSAGNSATPLDKDQVIFNDGAGVDTATLNTTMAQLVAADGQAFTATSFAAVRYVSTQGHHDYLKAIGTKGDDKFTFTLDGTSYLRDRADTIDWQIKGFTQLRIRLLRLAQSNAHRDPV